MELNAKLADFMVGILEDAADYGQKLTSEQLAAETRALLPSWLNINYPQMRDVVMVAADSIIAEALAIAQPS